MVSSSVGAGLVLNGRLYRGSLGLAGEIGHVAAVPGGAVCRCGARRCPPRRWRPGSWRARSASGPRSWARSRWSSLKQQVEAAITNGANVLVLDPVDSASAAPLVARAKQSQIPVISYDRLITNTDVDYYVSFDNEQVGKLQGESLVGELGDGGGSRS
jgi:hypothetical protein